MYSVELKRFKITHSFIWPSINYSTSHYWRNLSCDIKYMNGNLKKCQNDSKCIICTVKKKSANS